MLIDITQPTINQSKLTNKHSGPIVHIDYKSMWTKE